MLRPNDHSSIFRISVHAKLRHVEAFQFNLWCDTHTLDFVHDRKDAVRRAERPDGAECGAHQLTEKLSGLAVKQSCNSLACVPQVARRADAVPAGAISAVGEDADTDGS